jgi:hypothetical protein
MREFKRKQIGRQPLRLTRGADGRLRSAAGDRDIADIWAEQKRIRLQEAIEADKRRRAKAAARKARLQKLRSAKHIKASLKVLKLGRLEMPKLKFNKKKYFATAVIVLITGVGLVSIIASPEAADKSRTETKTTSKTLGVTSPEYKTLLPAGKTIESLGGWGRVSPPDKEPVFAYVDRVGEVGINVSQQPLPARFASNTADELAKLAEQFNANEKLTAGELTLYVGTSIKGPQSVVFIKDTLLILIRSDAKLANEQWTEYANSLQ